MNGPIRPSAQVSPPTASERYEDKNFVDTSRPVWNYSILYDDDISTFQNGTHYSMYNKFGSHPLTVMGQEGYIFVFGPPMLLK